MEVGNEEGGRTTPELLYLEYHIPYVFSDQTDLPDLKDLFLLASFKLHSADHWAIFHPER